MRNKKNKKWSEIRTVKVAITRNILQLWDYYYEKQEKE